MAHLLQRSIFMARQRRTPATRRTAARRDAGAQTSTKDRERERLRQSLIDRLTQIYRAVHGDVREDLLRDLPSQPDPRDEGDEASRVEQSDLRMRLDERGSVQAQLIEAAIRRITQGTYGECIDCGNDIEIERLRAIPWTPRCVDCQEALEREEQERVPTM